MCWVTSSRCGRGWRPGPDRGRVAAHARFSAFERVEAGSRSWEELGLQVAFERADLNADGLLRLRDVGFVFLGYLQQRGVGGLDFSEDVRRLMEVAELDAHVGDCGQCLMTYRDFSHLMDAYATSALSPAEHVRFRPQGDIEHEERLRKVLGARAGLERDGVLKTQDRIHRTRLHDDALLLSPADEAAEHATKMSIARRSSLHAKRQRRDSLGGHVHLLARRQGESPLVMCDAWFNDTYLGAEAVNASSLCSSGYYYDTATTSCVACGSCGPGYERTGCGWCSPGNCTTCSPHHVKNWTGNETCLQCPAGTGTLAVDAEGNQTACYYMWTCKQWKEWAGANASKLTFLALRADDWDYRYAKAIEVHSDLRTPIPVEAQAVYCDQETVGGGWMLMLSYYRDYLNGEPPNGGELPLDPRWQGSGYSHLYLKDFSKPVFRNATEVRFFCNTSAHKRQVHFMTGFNGIVGMAKRGISTYNNASWWTFNTTILPTEIEHENHTAILPLEVDRTNEDDEYRRTPWDGLTVFPFYKQTVAHWTLGTDGRWECDDHHYVWAATQHLVWTR
mmetsp:Transcript_5431/g.12658  ORF Transcript_5431/g.12658 Transcript_5431/m.12658 type:complete len:562 (-) Transcript_5431:108-1793(-)